MTLGIQLVVGLVLGLQSEVESGQVGMKEDWMVSLEALKVLGATEIGQVNWS